MYRGSTWLLGKRISYADVGWLAGIIDGEGCFHFRLPAEKYRHGVDAGLILSNTDNAIIQRFISLTGARVDERRFLGNRKPLVSARLGGDKLRRLVKVLLPHLTGKRRQAEIIQRVLEITWERRRVAVSARRDHRWQELVGLKAQLASLNHRGK